jgi:hypothetical protein
MLSGRYDLRQETLDFMGTVRLQATVSETMTGVKRVLLKPIDPLGDDIRLALVDADVVHGEDVRMIQRSSRTRFLLEAPKAIRIRAQRGWQHFDGDVSGESWIAGTIHLAHTTRAERAEDFVRTETRAG